MKTGEDIGEAQNPDISGDSKKDSQQEKQSDRPDHVDFSLLHMDRAMASIPMKPRIA